MRHKLSLAFLAALAFATPVLAWGHTGHGIVNHLAVDVLPEGALKAFFKPHQAYIKAHSVDPDIYKSKHRAEEGPRHYLNLCANGTKAEEYPRQWKTVVDKFGLHTATKQGRLPWATQETFDELVAAFKAKDGVKIIERATWLGHYVGDAHVPFHACANHDGADTGQKGIHSIWESSMLDHNEDLMAKEATKLAAAMTVAEIQGEVADWTFERLVSGDHAAHEVLALDKGNRASGREKALLKNTGEIAQKRLAESAQGLASLWLTAYAKAGKPELPATDSIKLPAGPIGGGPAGGAKDDDTDRGDEGAKGETPKPAETPKPTETPKPDEPKQAEAPKPAETPKADPNDKPSTKAVKGPIAGLMVRDDDDQPGAIVDFVEAGTAASSAGLQKKDVIISVDGAPVNSCGTLSARFRDYKSGDKVGLTILRAGAEAFVKVVMP